MIDSREVTKVFTDIKEKGILRDYIEINTRNYIEKIHFEEVDIESNQFNDYIEQFEYYRKAKGYTQEQIGQVIGFSGREYWKCENRIRKIKDIGKINKIAEFLGIREIANMPQKQNRISNEDIKEYLVANNINNTQFSKLIGISRRSIIDWFNQDVKISDENYAKVEKFIKDNENKKHNSNVVSEEDMEEF